MKLRVFCLVAFASLFLIAEFLPTEAAAQIAASVAQRDAQASTLVNAAVAALDVGRTVNDVTFQPGISSTAASEEETGTATFERKVGSLGNQNRAVLNLSGGQRQEIRSGTAGAWVGNDGQQHSMALHNCWTDAVWFFPGLSLQAALNDPTIAMTYVGLETHNSVPVQHLQLSRLVSAQSGEVDSLIQELSMTDLYLDATSLLPVAAGFNVHPDNNAGLNLPVEIQFGNYQLANGVLAPLHVEKLLQGSLLLDMSVTAVIINSGIPHTEFTYEAAGGAQ